MDEEELVDEIRNVDVRAAERPDGPREAETATPRTMDPAHRAKKGLPPWLTIGFVLVLLGAGVTVLLLGSGAGDAFTYSLLVDEVMEDPEAHRGRRLRVEGQLVGGSYERQSCEHRFVIRREDQRMSVLYPRCTVPDTFRDNGMELDVVVEGELQDDDTFLATQIIPRCPSKYEMRQRQQDGEAMPHGPAAGGETS